MSCRMMLSIQAGWQLFPLALRGYFQGTSDLAQWLRRQHDSQPRFGLRKVERARVAHKAGSRAVAALL